MSDVGVLCTMLVCDYMTSVLCDIGSTCLYVFVQLSCVI